MSPAKKSTRKKSAGKPRDAKKKPTPKTTKKKSVKKKPEVKKAAKKAASAKKAVRPKEPSAKKATTAAKPKPVKVSTKADKTGKNAPKKGKPAAGTARPAVIPADAHPRLGVKHTCFACGAKFYDLFRPEPTCPKCGADQRDAPPIEPKTKAPPKPKRVRKVAMSPLLDDDDDDAIIDDDAAPSLDLGDAGAEFDDPADLAADDDLDL